MIQVIDYFPDQQFWNDKVVSVESYKNPEMYNYYKTKFQICKGFEPMRIAEIGVGFGYSAFAFLAASRGCVSFVGYDNIVFSNERDATEDVLGKTWKLLNEYFPLVRVTLVDGDTQERQVLDYNKKFDFVHITGAYKYCANWIHNMSLAWKSLAWGGVLLIDECKNLKVKMAIDHFMESMVHEILGHEEVDSLRGDFIIRKKGN